MKAFIALVLVIFLFPYLLDHLDSSDEDKARNSMRKTRDDLRVRSQFLVDLRVKSLFLVDLRVRSQFL